MLDCFKFFFYAASDLPKDSLAPHIAMGPALSRSPARSGCLKAFASNKFTSWTEDLVSLSGAEAQSFFCYFKRRFGMAIQRFFNFRRNGACGGKGQANEVEVRLHLSGHNGRESLVVGSIVVDHGR